MPRAGRQHYIIIIKQIFLTRFIIYFASTKAILEKIPPNWYSDEISAPNGHAVECIERPSRGGAADDRVCPSRLARFILKWLFELDGTTTLLGKSSKPNRQLQFFCPSHAFHSNFVLFGPTDTRS